MRTERRVRSGATRRSSLARSSITSLQVSIARSSHSLRLQALAQPVAGTKQHHPKIIGRNLENLTDFPRLEPFHFAQRKCHAVSVGKSCQAGLELFLKFSSGQSLDRADWGTRPRAARIEPTLNHSVDIVVLCVSPPGPPFLPELSQEDAVDPGRGTRPPVKLRSASDKYQEARLDDILGPVRRQAGSLGRSEQSRKYRPDNPLQRLRIASPNR